MARLPDLGAVLSVSGASLLTTYVAGSSLPVGGAAMTRFTAYLTGKVASPINSFVVKLQSRHDATVADWSDMASTRDDDGTEELEHTYTATSTSTADYYSFHVDPRVALNGLRVLCKVSSTGAAGDSCVVYGAAW